MAVLRWAGLGAIVYVGLVVVGLILMLNGIPNGDAPPAKVIAYYSDSGHRDRIHVGWLLILVSVFFLLWFVAALRDVVRRLAGDGILMTVATIGGGVYAALTLASFTVADAVLTMSDDTYRHQVSPDLVHAANDTAYALHSAGGAAAGAMFVAASLAALGARAIPGWLGWLGVVAGVVAIFSIFFFPWFVIAVWFVLAGVLVTRAQTRLAPAST
jgi:hypothetical protein